jgi:lysophospholipase L1-like esterase
MHQLVQTLREQTQASLALCSIPVMGEQLDDDVNRAARLFNQAIERIANELDVAYLPVYETMAEVLRSSPRTRAVPFEQRGLGRRMLRAVFDNRVRHRSWDDISAREGLVLTTDLIHLNNRGAAIVTDQVERWLRAVIV